MYLPIGFYSNWQPYFKRECWKDLIGWNVYLNYNIEDAEDYSILTKTVVVYYNYWVACECRKLKRPIYLPFRYGNARFKVEIEHQL